MQLTVKSCTNPIWADEAKTEITCTVQFNELPSPLPFNAMASDPEPHGKKLFADLVAGKYGPIGAYVPPPAPPAAVRRGPTVVS